VPDLQAATALATRLRHARGERSMAEMADLVKVSRQTWFKWETAVVFPDDENLDRIADALEVSVADLFEDVA